jgi:hypothetical protein
VGENVEDWPPTTMFPTFYPRYHPVGKEYALGDSSAYPRKHARAFVYAPLGFDKIGQALAQASSAARWAEGEGLPWTALARNLDAAIA